CLVLQISALPSRVKRQGFGWEDDDDILVTQPQTRPQPRPQTRPQSRPQPQPPTSPIPAGSGTTTTTPSPQFSACVRRCPVTPEYNPVCGTDRITYQNEGRLRCARRCGQNVEKAFGGSCSPQ
ncbi:uncharacterized protein BDFB_005644, partial [Asbolus verrucosus]